MPSKSSSLKSSFKTFQAKSTTRPTLPYGRGRFHLDVSAMEASTTMSKKQRLHSHCRGCFCCSYSTTSSDEREHVVSGLVATVSSRSHARVQERLDKMIREKQGAREMVRRGRTAGRTKFIVMVAMEKYSYDPRQDFRTSMAEVLEANKIEEPRELRVFLNCYLSMNSDECRGLILQAFLDVCSGLFEL